MSTNERPSENVRSTSFPVGFLIGSFECRCM